MISNPQNFSEQFKNFIEHTATKIKEVEAKADAGGQGTVKSVQNISPDTSGNVDVSSVFITNEKWQEVADKLDEITTGEIPPVNPLQITDLTFTMDGSSNTVSLGEYKYASVYVDSVRAVEGKDYTIEGTTLTFTTTPAAGTEVLISKVWGGNSELTSKDAFVYSNLVQSLYPVGTYYWSETSTNPGTLFGGTWVEATNIFVLADGAATVYCWKRTA